MTSPDDPAGSVFSKKNMFRKEGDKLKEFLLHQLGDQSLCFPQHLLGDPQKSRVPELG